MQIYPFRSQSRIRRIIPVILLLAVFLWPFSVHVSTAQAKESQVPTKLESQVEEWISLLAKHEPFTEWQTADSHIEALGPGTHSWLVLFKKEGKDLGYMIVHATLNGTFQLGEYGLGPYPLYSQQLLKQSLIVNGLLLADNDEPIHATKHYLNPFSAAWEVRLGEDTYWLDAKTAEILPDNTQPWSKIYNDTAIAKQAEPEPDPNLVKITPSTTLKLNEPFDAYERLPWLTKENPFPADNAKKLLNRINGEQHLRYVTEPFGEVMLYAVPVIGYQRWSNGRLDLAVDMEGTRFIPLNAMLNKGQFYR